MAPGLRASFRGIRIAWLVLAGSLAVVVALWAWAEHDVRAQARHRAQRRTGALVLELHAHLNEYAARMREAAVAAQVYSLRGGEDLDAFLRFILEREDFQGFYGLGVCQLDQGAGGSQRCLTRAIASRNGRSHTPNLDHLSIPERVEAMERARDIGEGILTSPLRLGVDRPGGQPGSVILYLPIYVGPRPPDSLAARQKALRGYVFCPIPLVRFFQGIWDLQGDSMAVEIRDAASNVAMYRSAQWKPELMADPSLQATSTTEIGGRVWQVSLRPTNAFFTQGDNRGPAKVLTLGLFVSLLTFAVAFSLEGARARAEQMAMAMAGDAREKEARLREIAETMGEGMYVVDREGNIDYVNPEAGRLLGWEPQDLLGQNAHDLFHRQTATGERIPRNRCGILNVTLTGERYVSEEEVYWRRDDHPLAVSVTASPVIREGMASGAVAVFRDITRRKDAERELEQRNAWVRAMLDTPAYRMWIKDSEGRYMVVNAPFAQSCGGGMRPESVIGLTDFDLLPPEKAEFFAAADREVMFSRQPKSMEYMTEGPEGHRWTETFKTPILGRDGEVLGIAGLSRDITDRKEMEWALGHAQKLESLELMAGGIAHDFNNLFQGLLGNLELAQMDVADGSQAAVCLRRMSEILGRAARLSGDMLLYSGRSHLRHEVLDLPQLVNRAVTGGRATVEIEENLPDLEGDPAQIAKLLSILLENATEAVSGTDAGISLRVRWVELQTRDLAEGRWPEPGRPGPAVMIEVEDEGKGVPPEVMGRMFDPFYSTKAIGRGLGLPAALGILRGHHGQIQVFCPPGGGTRLRVYFPVPATRGAPVPGQPSSALPRMGVILLVDDDEGVRRSVAELIRLRLGRDVLEASGGREAVALFREHQERIVLILMDATMPEMDGIEAFAAIREIHPEAKAILCSGYGDEVGQAAVARHGFTAFLKKPFSLKDLEGLLAEHIEQR